MMQNTVGPVCNDIGLCDTSCSKHFRYSVAPINSSLLTATLHFPVRTTRVYENTKYSDHFMTL